MGSRPERGKHDDVPVKVRKLGGSAVVDGPGGGGGGTEQTTDLCGSRQVTLAAVNEAEATNLMPGAKLAWDTQDGRVVVIWRGAVVGELLPEDSSRLTQCVLAKHRYSMTWEGNGIVFMRKEA